MRQGHLEERETGNISGRSLDHEGVYEEHLAGILEAIVQDCSEERIEGVGALPGPSRGAIVEIIENL